MFPFQRQWKAGWHCLTGSVMDLSHFNCKIQQISCIIRNKLTNFPFVDRTLSLLQISTLKWTHLYFNSLVLCKGQVLNSECARQSQIYVFCYYPSDDSFLSTFCWIHQKKIHSILHTTHFHFSYKVGSYYTLQNKE